MSKEKIKKNFIYNLLNQFFSLAVPVVITPYVSRIFEADGIGINGYTTANVTYFMLFCMLGISGYGQRTIAINRNDKSAVSKIFWELQWIHFFTLIVTSAAYSLLVLFSENYSIYYVAHYSLLLSNFFDISWLYKAYEKFKNIAIRNILIKIFTLLFTFMFINEKDDLIIYIFIHSFGTLISNVSLWLGLKEYVIWTPFERLNLKRHFKDIMIFFLPTIAASIYSVLDRSVINWITHEEAQNGYYDQAFKLLQICNVIVQTLATVSSPRMSYDYHNESIASFKEKLNRYLRAMLMFSLPISFGVCAIACDLIPLYLGNGYGEVIKIVYVFMPLVVILGFSVYLDGLYLIPAGKRLQSSFAIIAGSITNLFLNYFLVSKFAAFGAAIATLITEILVSGIMIVLSKEIIKWKEIVKTFSKYFLFSIIMFFVVCKIGLWFDNVYIKLFLQVGTGGIIYLLLMFLIKDEFIMSLIKRAK